MILKGHRSIVNQVRFNSSNYIIASSGVEKLIKVKDLFIYSFYGSILVQPLDIETSKQIYDHAKK
jgi:WD repeat-containing protein 22